MVQWCQCLDNSYASFLCLMQAGWSAYKRIFYSFKFEPVTNCPSIINWEQNHIKDFFKSYCTREENLEPFTWFCYVRHLIKISISCIKTEVRQFYCMFSREIPGFIIWIKLMSSQAVIFIHLYLYFAFGKVSKSFDIY